MFPAIDLSLSDHNGGLGGTIPDDIGKLTKLGSLRLDQNDAISACPSGTFAQAGASTVTGDCQQCPSGQFSKGGATPCYATYTCDKDQGKCVPAPGKQSQPDCEAQGCAQQMYSCDGDSGQCVVNASSTQNQTDCSSKCTQTMYSCYVPSAKCVAGKAGTQPKAECDDSCCKPAPNNCDNSTTVCGVKGCNVGNVCAAAAIHCCFSAQPPYCDQCVEKFCPHSKR